MVDTSTEWNDAIVRLINWCEEHAYPIRFHNHPKTKAHWDKWMLRSV